jgi:uncharacterized protein (DUF111 family)
MNVNIDLRCGVAGDMILGAMMDWYSRVGDLEEAISEIETAASVMAPIRLSADRVERHGRKALSLNVSWRKLSEREVSGDLMLGYLDEAISLTTMGYYGKDLAHRILRGILDAEMTAHMVHSDEFIHLHETGTPDTIVDAVGLGILFEKLGLEGAWIQATPISLGYGRVETEHGVLEIPVPAVRAMIRNIPVRSGPVPGELATPTGVAAALSLVEIWMDRTDGGDSTDLSGERVGSGAGQKFYDPPFRNILDIYMEA